MFSYFPILFFIVYLQKYIYYFGDNLLLKHYSNELSFYKRRYIIKNIWKSFLLFIILLSNITTFFDGFVNNKWSNLSFKFWGTIYASVDLGGLYYVRGLPKETIIHHIIVNILGFLNFITDYNLSGYYRSMLIYTYFSVLPFIVNFYLGCRYLDKNKLRIKKIAKLSYYIYSLSLSLNILSQVIFFYSSKFSYSIFIYLFFYTLIINDDIKLIKFLRSESR